MVKRSVVRAHPRAPVLGLHRSSQDGFDSRNVHIRGRYLGLLSGRRGFDSPVVHQFFQRFKSRFKWIIRLVISWSRVRVPSVPYQGTVAQLVEHVFFHFTYLLLSLIQLRVGSFNWQGTWPENDCLESDHQIGGMQ